VPLVREEIREPVGTIDSSVAVIVRECVEALGFLDVCNVRVKPACVFICTVGVHSTPLRWMQLIVSECLN
jgi:hypothetical protein